MPSKSQYTTTICTTNIPDMLSMTSLFLIIHLTLQVTSQVLMQFQPVCHLTDYCTEMYSLVLCSVFTGQNNTKYWQLFFSKSAAEVACLRCSFLLIRFCSFFVLIWFLFFFHYIWNSGSFQSKFDSFGFVFNVRKVLLSIVFVKGKIL